ncbi:MAG TPA: hypothetical protein DCY88_08765 [Cyanobacteria bacterium UBA11372]|nr:hypothetical protein [Cyanobacteria bacterium UBA11372]
MRQYPFSPKLNVFSSALRTIFRWQGDDIAAVVAYRQPSYHFTTGAVAGDRIPYPLPLYPKPKI